jgi:plasmid maintenance system killer protein
MIKSRFSFVGHFIFWYLVLISLLAIYMTVGVAYNFTDIELVKNNLTNTESIIVLIIFPILIFTAFVQVKILGKVYEFDTINQQFTVSNYFGLRKRVFPFSDFNGFIDIFMRSSRGNFKVIYLLRNNEPSFKLSGRVLSNLEEIEKALGQIKYLGSQQFNLKWSPANRLEKLAGKLKDFYSIRINDQWRIIFKWNTGNASEVEIIDYH